jgi:hypothetical protein
VPAAAGEHAQAHDAHCQEKQQLQITPLLEAEEAERDHQRRSSGDLAPGNCRIFAYNDASHGRPFV